MFNPIKALVRYIQGKIIWNAKMSEPLYATPIKFLDNNRAAAIEAVEYRGRHMLRISFSNGESQTFLFKKKGGNTQDPYDAFNRENVFAAARVEQGKIVWDGSDEVVDCKNLLSYAKPLPEAMNFTLDEEQVSRYEHWTMEHKCKYRRHKGEGRWQGVSGGIDTFSFTPTGLGIGIEVKCCCGATLDLSEWW